MRSITIQKDQSGKTYHFDKTTFLKMIPGEFGYKEYFFTSARGSLYADNVRFNPCEIYTNAGRNEYVKSIYFDKSFPLIDRNKPTQITWTSFHSEEIGFRRTVHILCRKDGEKIIQIKYESALFGEEKLFFEGTIDTHEIEFFTALIYAFHYPEQNRPNKG